MHKSFSCHLHCDLDKGRFRAEKPATARILINIIMMKQKHMHAIIVNPSTMSLLRPPSRSRFAQQNVLSINFSFFSFSLLPCDRPLIFSFPSHPFSRSSRTEWKLIFIVCILVPGFVYSCACVCWWMSEWMCVCVLFSLRLSKRQSEFRNRGFSALNCVYIFLLDGTMTTTEGNTQTQSHQSNIK